MTKTKVPKHKPLPKSSGKVGGKFTPHEKAHYKPQTKKK